VADVELTGAQTRELQAIGQAVINIEDLILRAEKAGLDVADLKAQLARAEAQRKGLLAQFSPGTSARRQR
jgi:hypothetical protein